MPSSSRAAASMRAAGTICTSGASLQRAAPVMVTQPVTFLQLVWAMLLGTLVFAEPLDFWVVMGGAIILASVTFITWREAVLGRRAITPPAPATKT